MFFTFARKTKKSQHEIKIKIVLLILYVSIQKAYMHILYTDLVNNK